ncbi:histone-lysine N-methyltransferase SETMAR [Trichonephila clavipes]|nr:histone-lysine N-methyltransferase SETMAR [Trichonephila clavipes]
MNVQLANSDAMMDLVSVNYMSAMENTNALMDLMNWKIELVKAEIVNAVYGADTITANYVQFPFRQFRSGIFDVKDALRTGRSVVENVDKITEIIEFDRHVTSRNIALELKIDHQIVLSHLCKSGFKKKLDVWVPHQLT